MPGYLRLGGPVYDEYISDDWEGQHAQTFSQTLRRGFCRSMETYPFKAEVTNGIPVDASFPGTAVIRLSNVLSRVSQLTPEELSGEWSAVRSKLLWAGGLREDRSTSHAFNDDNHCDLTTMMPQVSHQSNASGEVTGISRQNQLGPHIEAASLPELGDGGSWSTCTNGASSEPPHDVAHVQFKSRVAFKLVWCPPEFDRFVLVGDEGALLASGKPTGQVPPLYVRQNNFALVDGGRYSAAAKNL